jgi:hypothetical protein
MLRASLRSTTLPAMSIRERIHGVTPILLLLLMLEVFALAGELLLLEMLSRHYWMFPTLALLLLEITLLLPPRTLTMLVLPKGLPW